MEKVLTLSFIIDNEQVLLGMKKRGFGVGRWNGFGGKVEAGETVEAAAGREVEEEIGVIAREVSLCGRLTFTFKTSTETLLVYVYRITKWQGEPVETEEMRPQWFTEAAIPYQEMWSDDIHWLPLLLAGQCFVGSFHFDRPATADHPATILSQELQVVPHI